MAESGVQQETALHGTSVIVTGAGTGIGRATAHAFADAGANVLIVGRRQAHLAATAQEHQAIRSCCVDITAADAPELIANTTMTLFGRIDVLVNNAAMVVRAPLGKIDDKQARRQIDTNLMAPLRLAQACLQPLLQSGGTIINVSTAGTARGWPTNSVYGATKAALDFLTRTWAVELAPQGMRVVGVAPGPVNTEIAENSGLGEEQVAQLRAAQRKRVPIGRIGRPEEIAWWIVNLARPQAAFTTGVVVAIDGGTTVAF
jgi:meso-butanediol dehydrogenase/(S,S)-butanediol dehydrogenase/diacetyl reductase